MKASIAAVVATASWLAACGRSPVFFTPQQAPPATPAALTSGEDTRWFTRVTYARLDTRALDGRADLELEPGVSVQLQGVRSEPDAGGGYTWIGKTPEGDLAVLLVRDDKIHGTVRTGSAVYRISPHGPGRHRIARLSTNLPPHHPETFEQVEKAPRPPARPGPPSGTQHTIDVVVEYTRKARAACPDVADEVGVALRETNVANHSSEVPIDFGSAHVFEQEDADDYEEHGRLDTDLYWFMNADDGELDAVHSCRDKYAGDLAVLVVDGGGMYLGTSAVIYATSETAFTVVDCRFLTGYLVLAHEIGHLMGARHDVADDPATTPYPYGHGYRYPATGGQPAWATIMVAKCGHDCNRLASWSNPRKDHLGAATGTVTTNDVARALGESADQVSQFRDASRPRSPPPQRPPRPPCPEK